MGRWLFIVGVTLTQWVDTAAAGSLPPDADGRGARSAPQPAIPDATRAAVRPGAVGPGAARRSGAHGDRGEDREDAPVAAPTQWRKYPGTCRDGRRTISSYYWEGSSTASGAAFDPRGLTAAHRTLPFGTRLTVSNPLNGRSVNVVINDRGPFVAGVALDLSLGAANALGMRGNGAVCVR